MGDFKAEIGKIKLDKLLSVMQWRTSKMVVSEDNVILEQGDVNNVRIIVIVPAWGIYFIRVHVFMPSIQFEEILDRSRT